MSAHWTDICGMVRRSNVAMSGIVTPSVLAAGVAVVIILAAAHPLGAQSRSDLSLEVAPVGGLSLTGAGAMYGVEVIPRWRLPLVPFIYAVASLGHSWLPLNGPAQTTVNMWNSGVGGGLIFDLPPFAFSAGARYGAVWWEEQDSSALTPWDWDYAWRAGGAVAWRISPLLSVETRVEYATFGALYSGVNLTIGTAVHIPAVLDAARAAAAAAAVPSPGGATVGNRAATDQQVEASSALREASSALRIEAIELPPVLPALLAYHRANLGGRLVMRNPGPAPITDLVVTATPAPTAAHLASAATATVPRLEVGATVEVPIPLELSADVDAFARARETQLAISVSYRSGGRDGSLQLATDLIVYDRNAMMWHDHARVAAFVTPEQPAIINLAQLVAEAVAGVAAAVNAGAGSEPEPALLAAATHGVFSHRGLTYGRDFITPLSAALRNPAQVDYVQYPAETLASGLGDELDIALLYAATLEAAGVETALILDPQAVLVLVAVAPTGEVAAALAGLLSDSDGRRWLSIDPRAVDRGFAQALTAGQAAAQRLRIADRGSELLVRPRAAWQHYPPAYQGGSAGVLPGGRRAALAAATAAARAVGETGAAADRAAGTGSE